MARIKVDLGKNAPNLSGLNISTSALERYKVVEARTSLGRRIAIPYLEDCTKLLAFDGSSVWDGDYVPEAGLFGQRCATTRTLILCAHEFEALRVASVIEDDPKLKHLHAVALPFGTSLGRLGMSMLVDSLKVVCDELLVWNATIFDSLRDSVEMFVAAVDEASGSLNVSALSLGRMHSPLDLSNDEIRNILKGPRRKWSPSNLTTAAEILESSDFFSTKIGFSTGIERLDTFIRKLRKSELVMFVAGTGVGKSTLLRQVVYNLAFNEGQICGVAFLEETKEETLKKFACIHYGISNEDLLEDPHRLTDAQWVEFEKNPGVRNLHFITQPESSGGFGGMDVDVLLGTARYLKRKGRLDFLAVDHLSIMVSGKESSREGERKDIDIMMTKLAMACVILGVGILGVCHLSNPDGKPHEEGGRVLLQHMRGSGSLKQLSWCVLAQERDQQGDNNRVVLVRVLKNRNGGGRTGPAAVLEFRDPYLVERLDLDPFELAANMGNAQRSNDRPARKPRNDEPNLRHSPFESKPGRKVSFGKLAKDETEGNV